jgi:hypothetical protein
MITKPNTPIFPKSFSKQQLFYTPLLIIIAANYLWWPYKKIFLLSQYSSFAFIANISLFISYILIHKFNHFTFRVSVGADTTRGVVF